MISSRKANVITGISVIFLLLTSWFYLQKDLIWLRIPLNSNSKVAIAFISKVYVYINMGLIFYFAFVKFPILKVAKMAGAAMPKDIRPMSWLLDRVAKVLVIVFLGLITLRIFRVIGDEWMPWIFGVFFISIGILGLIQCIRAKNSLKTSPEFAAVYRTTFFIMWFAIIVSILLFIEATVDIPNGVILLFFLGSSVYFIHISMPGTSVWAEILKTSKDK